MERCQHNQKLSKFCATECCVWKQSAGCNNCMKKYHNHMGPSVFVDQKDIQTLLKKYKTQTTTKPKVKTLQQTIHNYFTSLKQCVTNSLDQLNKKIRSQLCYPFLTKANLIGIYKKLKKKEYKKLNQKQFRSFYEITHKLQSQQFNKQQKKLYEDAILKHATLINQLIRNFSNIESQLQQYDISIKMSDKINQNKIVELLEMIKNVLYQQREDQIQMNKKMRQRNINNPSSSRRNSLSNYQQNNKLQILTFNTSANKPYQKTRQGQRNAQNSSALKNKKKSHEKQKSSVNNSTIKQQQLSEMKKKLLNLMEVNKNQKNFDQELQLKKHQSIELHLKTNYSNCSNNQSEKKDQKDIFPTQQKKNHLFPHHESFTKTQSQQISPTHYNHYKSLSPVKNLQPRTNHFEQSNITSPNKFHQQIQPDFSPSKHIQLIQSPKQLGINTNSNHSLNLGDNNLLKIPFIKKTIQMKNYQLPGRDTQVFLQNKQKETVQRDTKIQNMKIQLMKTPNNNFRAFVIPIKGQINLQADDDSPIVKQKIFDSKSGHNDLMNLKIINKQDNKIKLKANEQKSIALLAQSLKIKTQDAIPLLYKALQLAPNNLSSAQYLSFILLQVGKPIQCLKVCNNILSQLQGQIVYDINSLHIQNNKAVSLIMLGRYSESIPILQKCIEIHQCDRFYKNLGDAYYSIGIYEKSTYNYEKSICINDNSAQTHYNLAVAHYSQENYSSSLLHVQKALKLQPRRDDYSKLLIELRLKL